MKKERQIAINWAIVALIASMLMVSLLNMLGIEKDLVSERTILDLDGQKIVIPTIAKEWSLLFFPLMVFGLKYFYLLYQKDSKEFTRETILATSIGTIIGTILGAINGTINGTIDVIIGIAIFGTLFGVIFGNISISIFVAIFLAMFGAANIFVGAISNYSIAEALFITLGSAVCLLAVNIMAISIIPMIWGLLEKIFSKTFWVTLLSLLKTNEVQGEKATN